MYFGISSSLLNNQVNCLILGFCSDTNLDTLLNTLSPTQQKLAKELMAGLQEKGDWTYQASFEGCSLLLYQVGKSEAFTADSLKQSLQDIISFIQQQKHQSICLSLPPINEKTANQQLKYMALQISALHYQCLDFKTVQKKSSTLETVNFYLPGAEEKTLKDAESMAAGIALTRYLVDLPANHCTPTFMAEQAQKLSQEYDSLHAKIMGPEVMQELGMGALLAVAQGSVQPPRLIELRYQGAGEQAPIILVGKGITFDSGGLSIKPANAMDEMKYDMAGAASVLGVLKACALLKLPLNVIGLMPCAENMPSGQAVKPGDIIKTMSGQTVEIINTDAEGRLVLADALTYAERFNPKMVLDMATLTGAVIVALGHITTGFMANNEEVAQLIEQAGKDSHDKIWRLPLDEAYQESLDSPIADMINASFDRTASSIVAACFLSRFTKKYPWAHLDIAGTAAISGKKRQATGRPVSLILELLIKIAYAN